MNALLTPHRAHSSTNVAQNVACASAWRDVEGSIVSFMKVEIWSDVVCPWCYIGKKRFEDAVQRLSDEGTEIDLEVTFRPFQLDPSAPVGGTSPVAEAYAKKFGGPDKAAKIIDHVTRVASDSGIEFNMDIALRANTLRAHRMMHLALLHNGADAQRRMKQRLLEAYFTEGRNVAADDVLLEAATAAGIPVETAQGLARLRRRRRRRPSRHHRGGRTGHHGRADLRHRRSLGNPRRADVDVFVRALRRMHEKSLAGE